MYMNAENLFPPLAMKKNSGIRGRKRSKTELCLTMIYKALWITAVAQGPCFVSLQRYTTISRRGGNKYLSFRLQMGAE